METKCKIYFLTPPSFERITTWNWQYFKKHNYSIEIFEYEYSDNYKKIIDQIFDSEDNAVVAYPSDRSISDYWVAARIKNKKGKIDNVIDYIKSKGIVAFPIDMYWGGDWEDTIDIYGTPEQALQEIEMLIQEHSNSKS